MRKTKIVCTLGPATDNEDVLRQMMLAGMNVARCNFSHATYDEHKKRMDMIKKLRVYKGAEHNHAAQKPEELKLF